MDRSSKLALAFVFLFAMPFAGFGLFALSAALRQMVTGVGDKPVWLPLLFGVLFSAIGFGLMIGVLYGNRLNQRTERRQAEHPTQPWLWRDDWAQGRVLSKTRGNMVAGWVFAVLWNLISAPTAYFVSQQAAKKPVALVGLVFPVAGVFLLIRAILQTLEYREFGKTYFELTTIPGVIGRELKGAIQARFPHSPDHGIHLRLSCVHRVTTGSGDSQSTTENILWRDEADLSSGHLCPGPSGTTIPVTFRIPWDAQATEKRNLRDEIVWLLEALADVPGVDYHDIFEVPVFRTQQTPAQPGPEPQVFSTAHNAARPEAMTVEVRETANGTEFFFPAARNKGFGATTGVFLVIFGAATFFLFRAHIPIIFALAFGFFALLMLYITIQMWFGTTRVVIGGGLLSLQDGLLGGGKVRQFRCADIQSINTKITAQQGGATGTAYYDIQMSVPGRTMKVTLGRTLRNKHEADWLVERMRTLVGLKSKSMTAATS
jgi:hypothetical protein